MKILFIHQSFPGQFKHLIDTLNARGDEISYIGPDRNDLKLPKFVNFYPYVILRGNGSDTHLLALETETKVIRGEAVAKIAFGLKENGYKPDVIIAHPGWGESLFLKEVWKETPQLHYIEFSYNTQGSDTDFNDRYRRENDLQECSRTRMKNANVYLNLDSMDWGISPTHFQKSTVPEWAKTKISVIHDGIDTNWASPKSNVKVKINDQIVLSESDEIITFVNRTFEPYRGIHIFLESLCDVLRERPKAQVILVGEDTPNVSYGERRADGIGWLTYLRNEIHKDLDWSRVHHVGRVNHNLLIDIFRISSAHVYLTYPFVLSWSLLEAMSCGCLIIGSDTLPVREVISQKQNGILTPFHDTTLLAKNIISALDKPSEFENIRARARKSVIKNYSIDSCIKKQLALIDLISSKIIAA